MIAFVDPDAARVGSQTLRMLPHTVGDFLARHPRLVEVMSFPYEVMAEDGAAGDLGLPPTASEPLTVEMIRELLDPSLMGEELLHAADHLHNPRRSLGAAIAKTPAGQDFIKAMQAQDYTRSEATWEIFAAPARAWSADPRVSEPALTLLNDPQARTMLDQAYALLGRALPPTQRSGVLRCSTTTVE